MSIFPTFHNLPREEDLLLQSPPPAGPDSLARSVRAARLLAVGALWGPASPPAARHGGGRARGSPLSRRHLEGSRHHIWSDQRGLGGRSQWEKGKELSPVSCPLNSALMLRV